MVGMPFFVASTYSRRLLVHGYQFEARLVAALVERNDLAGIDELRVLDLVRVQLPQLAPAVGIVEELGGDAPQGVSGRHHVPVGGAIGELQGLRALCEHQGA
jgi:hypothetical protein